MTREEHLKFCKVCIKKDFNFNKGIVCSLTDEIADFEINCLHFVSIQNKKIEIEDNSLIFEKIKQEKTVVKRKRIKKEKITKNDLLLLTSVSLFSVLLLRIILYAKYSYETVAFWKLYLIIFSIFSFIALILRKRKAFSIIFFRELKFIAFFSIIASLINSLYLVLVYKNFSSFISGLNFFVIVTFHLSLVSALLLTVLSRIINRFTK